MDTTDKVQKNLQNALKLSGFNIRREFCCLLVTSFIEGGVDLNDGMAFETMIRNLCASLENQCLAEKSIEKEHIERAIEVCLHSGYDRYESIFNIINAFDFPKLSYNPDRKLYFIDKSRSTLLAKADIKAKLFLDRYYTILQRTKRNFQQKVSAGDKNQLKLQTVDYLLTLSNVTLEFTLILGSLIQVSEGKWHLEDPTGMVELNLTHAKFHAGFFMENCVVLVNGYYEDRILHVSTVVLPPGEEYANSRISFGSLNYFGGNSSVPLRDSLKLKEHLNQNKSKPILFFSDVWLDHQLIFEKLEFLFAGFEDIPPIAFIFMGNFMSNSQGNETMQTLRKLFKKLAELILKYPGISTESEFVFVPGLADPCTLHIVPRLGLPDYVTGEMKRLLPKAIFPTNPCRLQYCNREIVLFRADLVPKFLQGTLHKPPKEQIVDCIKRTVISQGHLSPLSLNSLTVHWDYDHTLRLYPLPDLVVVGDKFEAYAEDYKGCLLVNPGSFCEGFQFKSYTPFSNTCDDCDLDMQT
nr:DNA polymerase epsilon subunit 2 [Leptinotarsa decemlineata]